MKLEIYVTACLSIALVGSILVNVYYYNEYMNIAYPSGQMESILQDIQVVPDPWGYRDFDYIIIKYHGGKIVFGETNVPIDKIQNLNYTPYVVYKNNKTYVYQNSWSWTWHTEDRLEPGIESFYIKVKVLDDLSCNGYGWNVYDGYLNRTAAIEKFGW